MKGTKNHAKRKTWEQSFNWAEREELEPDDIVQALNQALLKVFSAPKSLVDERLITNKAKYHKTPKRLRGVASNEGPLVSVSYSTIILYNKPIA